MSARLNPAAACALRARVAIAAAAVESRPSAERSACVREAKAELKSAQAAANAAHATASKR